LTEIIPLETNILFDLAYPSAETISLSVLTRQDLNAFVDSVLDKIFGVSDHLETQPIRRKITFTSFSPDVCSALNWKQPNCMQMVSSF
jgi:CDK inhibitor PHO81